MKLTKENVYIDLRGKSEEELTELYWLLKNNNEKLFHNNLSVFIEEYYKTNRFLEYYTQRWGGGDNLKTEVTIEQLKEIINPIDLPLEQQLQKAEAEVKRLKEAIDDSKIKEGDWVKHNNNNMFKVEENKYDLGVLNESKEFKKITNQELIKLLQQEII